MNPVPASAPSPASFASLAKRIRGWTTNLLATALVAVLALAIGRQLISWWRVEPNGNGSSNQATSIALPDVGGGQALELGFGSLPYPLQCRTLRGDLSAATGALTTACRELAVNAPPLSGLGPAEQQLLALVSQAEPVERGPGSLEVFAAPQGMPVVVVTGTFPAEPEKQEQPGAFLPPLADGQPETQASSLKPVGTSQRRVVTWGLAAAAVEGEWNLYIAHAGQGRGNSPRSPDMATSPGTISPSAASADPATSSSGLPDLVPEPPGSKRSLSLRNAAGGGLIALAGPGQPDAWMAFYTDWFNHHGWQPIQAWQSAAGRWHARFRRSGEPGPVVADVQFGPSGGGLSGLISITAAEQAGDQ